MLTISRLCNPSSELFIAEHYYRSTAMSDLLGIPVEKINEQRLYRALDKLLSHKEALAEHLKNRLDSLFNLEYDLLMYDVTSTYFGGEGDLNRFQPHFQRVFVVYQQGPLSVPSLFDGIFGGDGHYDDPWRLRPRGPAFARGSGI